MKLNLDNLKQREIIGRKSIMSFKEKFNDLNRKFLLWKQRILE